MMMTAPSRPPAQPSCLQRLLFLVLLLCNVLAYRPQRPVVPRAWRAATQLAAAPSTTELVQEVNAWVASQGTKDSRITVTAAPDGTLYATAATAVKKGEVLHAMPLGVCWTAASTKFASTRLRTGAYGMLALQLLSEKALGSASKYAAYVKSLVAARPPGMLGWTDAEVAELVSSTTRNVRGQLDAVAADWAAVVSTMPAVAADEAAWRWAMGHVKSRALFLDAEPMLCPGLDFIGFDPLSTADPATDSAGIFGGKVANVRAERSYAAGEAVVMSYGLKSSAECLEDHGIIPDIILDDASCEITCAIDGTEKYPDDKRDVLERAGYGGRSRRFDLEADIAAAGGMDPALLQFLRLKLLEGKDCFILEACFADTVWYTLGQPFSKPNEVKVFEYLETFCRTNLARMNAVSTAARDEALGAEAWGQSPAQCMARLRVQERAVLEANLKLVEAELATLASPVDPREYYQERRLRELNLLRPLDESEVVLPGERGPLDDNY
jgi:hypothetical protein